MSLRLYAARMAEYIRWVHGWIRPVRVSRAVRRIHLLVSFGLTVRVSRAGVKAMLLAW